VLNDGTDARAEEQKNADEEPASEAAPAPEPEEVEPSAPDANAVDEPQAPAAAAPEQGNAEPASYTVKAGQSLWSIATEQLGNGERFRDILRLNPALRNPNAIYPGLELKMPESQ